MHDRRHPLSRARRPVHESGRPAYYSHKFGHAALTYNVALSLGPNPRIVYIGGGVPAGEYPDWRALVSCSCSYTR